MLEDKYAYIFDTTGCLIIRDVLAPEEVKLAIQAINNNWPEQIPWKFPVMHLDRVFWRMLTNELLLDFSEVFCGEHFRLDHAFGLTSNNAVKQLHGGPQSSQYSCFYMNLPHNPRRALAGQLNFGFCLQPQSPETGGFVYMPGSHKASDPRPGLEVLRDVFYDDLTHHSLVVPTLNPGDLMVFTEALIHGDTGWNQQQTHRMQVYFKMTPGFMCWRDPEQGFVLDEYAETELEKRIVNKPWTGRYSENSKSMGGSNDRREPTRQTHANS